MFNSLGVYHTSSVLFISGCSCSIFSSQFFKTFFSFYLSWSIATVKLPVLNYIAATLDIYNFITRSGLVSTTCLLVFQKKKKKKEKKNTILKKFYKIHHYQQKKNEANKDIYFLLLGINHFKFIKFEMYQSHYHILCRVLLKCPNTHT